LKKKKENCKKYLYTKDTLRTKTKTLADRSLSTGKDTNGWKDKKLAASKSYKCRLKLLDKSFKHTKYNTTNSANFNLRPKMNNY